MALLFEELVKKNGSQLLRLQKRVIIETIPDIRLELTQIFKQLAEDPSWVFEDLTQKDTSYATHGFHKYPAKFIPQLAKRCIEENTKINEIVCDPFMGCGTTLIESLVSGRKTVGVDINPVAYLISKVKTTPINPEKLKQETDKVLFDLEMYFKSKNQKQKTLSKIEIVPVIPTNERINYWFPDKKSRDELSIILGRIDTIKDKDIRDFCLCAFSNILKNASIWLMKSIKPTRDLNKKIDIPMNLFSRQIKKMIRGNDVYWNILSTNIKGNLKSYLNLKKADARNLPAENNSVSLIVTSPPYVTSYEYADLHQLTALWLEYTKSVNEGRACIVIGNTELKKVPILNAEVFTEMMISLGFKIHKIIKRRIPSKVLPQTRDSKTGRFTSTGEADRLAYAYEYILIMEKLWDN